ncbi:prepilin-type N-terminal cleavage/methylation domain-containing protein [Alkalihalophilus pseudofirmus]|uniref:prepilin-type N-terminal cleavage/methylation domain-containing protein n=1 Tax=Alkalihalophilus pseudofirmus TaxID=79885 RepID=UPI00259AF86E|nr:prepilin-type N-terminal cleavage/methylation domain-containing protein [Alkalihalophilus pseudofirmus]WEG17382.1 prepilin-type N-terminal cleavage/methylation domain-containing protein [Alkalihalophilus pseudofirmus]
MHRPRFRINNNGLTLIEVLASMVILSIVIISFMTFFSQSMMFSNKVEDRLTAVNLAEKVLVDVRTAKSIELGEYDTSDEGNHYFQINNKYYYIQAEEVPDQTHLNLIPFYVDVSISEDFNEKDTTRLYGYIENN